MCFLSLTPTDTLIVLWADITNGVDLLWQLHKSFMCVRWNASVCCSLCETSATAYVGFHTCFCPLTNTIMQVIFSNVHLISKLLLKSSKKINFSSLEKLLQLSVCHCCTFQSRVYQTSDSAAEDTEVLNVCIRKKQAQSSWFHFKTVSCLP